jgi:hypothetical protein
MSLLKTLTAGLAGAGLMLAQPAFAQNAADVPVDEMGVPKAANPLVFLLGITALVVVLNLLFEDDGDDDSFPTSP